MACVCGHLPELHEHESGPCFGRIKRDGSPAPDDATTALRGSQDCDCLGYEEADEGDEREDGGDDDKDDDDK